MASVSFEVFPPRTPEAEQQLWSALERLAPLDPSFVSVTCGANRAPGSGISPRNATICRTPAAQ